MPKIPTYSAEGGTAVVQYGRAPIQDFSGLYRAGEDVQSFGSDLSRIAAMIKNQKDATEAANLIGQYNGKMKETQLQLKFEKTDSPNENATTPEGLADQQIPQALKWNDPNERTQEFVKRARVVQKELGGSASNGNVSKIFGAYVGRHFPTTVYTVHADGLEDAIKIQHGKMDELEILYARDAASAATPEDRNVAVNTYKDLVDKAVQNRIFDPVQGEARKRRFDQKAQYEYMDILVQRRDFDKLDAENKAGAFNNMDPDTRERILTRAENIKAAELAKGDTKRDRENKVFVEGVERDVAVHIQNRTLSREKIEEARPYITSEKYEHYGKIYDLQQRGIGVGDPQIEKKLEGEVYRAGQTRGSLQNLNDTIIAAAAAGKVGTENLAKWGSHLTAEINRLSTEERTIQNEADNRKHQVQSAQGAHWLENANIAFRNHGALDKFDLSAQIGAEALGQFREEFGRNVDYLGGTKDAESLYRELMPKYIVHVDSRLSTREDLIRQQLTPRYMDKASLNADKEKLGQNEYERRALMLQEFYAIQRERARLAASIKSVQTTKPQERFH